MWLSLFRTYQYVGPQSRVMVGKISISELNDKSFSATRIVYLLCRQTVLIEPQTANILFLLRYLLTELAGYSSCGVT